MALEWASLWHLRQATSTEYVHEWLGVIRRATQIGSASLALILVAGFSLMALGQFSAAWLIVAFGAFVLLAVLQQALTGPRLAAVRRTVPREQGPVPSTLTPALRHPLLWVSMQTRLALAVGIVFLMTVKPDLGGALLVIGTAILLGLVSASAIVRRGGARVPAKRVA